MEARVVRRDKGAYSERRSRTALLRRSWNPYLEVGEVGGYVRCSSYRYWGLSDCKKKTALEAEPELAYRWWSKVVFGLTGGVRLGRPGGVPLRAWGDAGLGQVACGLLS